MASTFCDSCVPDRYLKSLAKRHGTPILLLDCEQLRRQYSALREALPSVTVYYAVKALSHPRVLATLRDVGCSFDIASAGEIDLLREQGVPADRTIHTHPIKSTAEIRAAVAYGCKSFVVDNATEIEKFCAFSRSTELLLRVSFRSPDAVVDLSKKFGCSEQDVLPLLGLAHSLGLRVKGLSFHVGSQCGSSQAHVAAIEACAELMLAAERFGLPPLQVLDIGGGFPVAYRPDVIGIAEFCRPIRDALAKLPPGLQLISEPGRYLAAPAVHAVSSVVGKARRGESIWYYLDDGAYGSYSGQIYDGARYPLSVLTENGGPNLLSVLAGPTCDSIDMVSEQIWLPELGLADLVVGHMMGAYTSASASEFNSFPKAKIVILGAAVQEVVADLKRTAN